MAAERRGEGERVGGGVVVVGGGGAGGAGAGAEVEAEAATAAAVVSPRCCAAEATNVGGAAHQPAEEEGEAERGAGCDKGDRGDRAVGAIIVVAVVVIEAASSPALLFADEDAACTGVKSELLCLCCGAAPAKRGSEARLLLLLRGAINAAAAAATAVDVDIDDAEAPLPDDARSFRPVAVELLLP